MALQQFPQIKVVDAAPLAPQRRVTRRPNHAFNLKTQPFAIVPFMIAPVLPGETLTNLLLQARVVTDPVQNPLIGWWKEYYFFYVKHRGLPSMAADLSAMMLDTSTDMSAHLAGANSAPLYTFKGGMNFVDECLEVVTEEFFRDEGEAHDVATIGGYPKAITEQGRWWHSLKLEAAGQDDDELPGVDELEDMNVIPGMTTEYGQWEQMRDLGLTDLTYEDYLKSYGVDIPKEEVKTGDPQIDHKPELVRFVREWKYPTNHVDPADGSPSSALSWSIAERADKRRFFKEPGFLFGVTVTRPKLYFGNQKGAAVGAMSNAYRWLPAVLAGHPYASLIETAFSATDGILQNQSADYWFDVADLLVHGDQFVNYAATIASGHAVNLPSTTLEKRFVADADIADLFVTETTAEFIKEDGNVSLSVLSKARDTTRG